MKKILLISTLLLITARLILNATPQAATGTLEGTVVNAVTLQPISNVPISVTRGDSASPFATATPATADTITKTLLSQGVAAELGAASQTNILSDPFGHFVVPDILPGPYIVGARLEGYLGPGINGVHPPGIITNVNVAEKQTTNVTMSLTPGGTISGLILDDLGSPAADASVQLLRISYTNGIPTAGIAGSQTTDDRGNYRIYGLSPGDYYTSVIPKQSTGAGTSTASGLSTVRTFFPNGTDLSQASLIKLHAGEEIPGINIRVKTATRSRISGQVLSSIPASGSVAAPNAALTLHDRSVLSDPNSSIGTVISMGDPANGHFEIPNVPSGVYDLYVSLPDLNELGPAHAIGRTTIDVRGGDLDGVNVTVHKGIDIKGRVTVDGSTSPSINNIRISLQPDDSASKIPVYQQVGRFQPMIDPDGSFNIPSVPEAQYRFQITFSPAAPSGSGPRTAAAPPALANSLPISPLAGIPLSANSYVADILQSGMSVYDTGIYVGAQNIEPLDIRVKTNGGGVDGVVNGPSRKTAAGATVVLVPSLSHRQNPAFYKTATSDGSGRFSMNAVPPGEYRLFAWETIPAGAYMNADVLRNYAEKAITVNVPAGLHLETQVNLIPVEK